MKGFLINLDSSEDRLRQVEGRLFGRALSEFQTLPYVGDEKLWLLNEFLLLTVVSCPKANC